MFQQGSLKVMNKHSFRDINRMLSAYLVFINILKKLAQNVIYTLFFLWNI